MKRRVVWMFLAGGLCLGACAKGGESWGDQHGRYQGVGLYTPSRQWTRFVANQQTREPDAAKPIDDQVIIVVEDSRNGEVRACGDLTGYCIGMNPWKTGLVSSQVTPIKLTEHVRPEAKDSDADSTPPPSRRDAGGASLARRAPLR